jgi:hypothetical protein
MSGLWLARARTKQVRILAHASFNGNLTDRHLSGGWVKGGTWSYATAPSGFGQELSFAGAGVAASAGAVNLALGTLDFTVECFCKPTALTSQGTVLAQSQANGNTYGAFRIEQQGRKYNFLIGGTKINYWVGGTDPPSANAMYNAGERVHLALVRRGAVFTLYVKGNAYQTRNFDGAVYPYSEKLVVGALLDSAGNLQYQFKGTVDEVRITRGQARYLANFTPPTAPF